MKSIEIRGSSRICSILFTLMSVLVLHCYGQDYGEDLFGDGQNVDLYDEDRISPQPEMSHCPLGFYGKDCKTECPVPCGSCTVLDGTCYECRNSSMWGPKCNLPCKAENCQLCDIAVGTCLACLFNFTLEEDLTCKSGIHEDKQKAVGDDKVDEFSAATLALLIVSTLAAVLLIVGVLSPTAINDRQPGSVSSTNMAEKCTSVADDATFLEDIVSENSISAQTSDRSGTNDAVYNFYTDN